MKILTAWLRAYLPDLPVEDRQLAEDLTLRGIAVEGVHDLGRAADGEPNGHLFEMDITTNRVDAMNHYGIAREAATVYDLELAPLGENLTLASTNSNETLAPLGDNLALAALGNLALAPLDDLTLATLGNNLTLAALEASPSPAQTGGAPFPVRIEAPALCGRFTARVLRDVRIGPSTGQVRRFFDLLGQKPIANAVDASNFTLLGMGHPTHAFDLDKIDGSLVVRLARAGETLRLLDGSTRTLDGEDLVVADERKALALAGVMGGWDSMITSETRNILVEAAWFDPAAVRRSSRRHLLHTDASHRFERGADFNAAPLANALVSQLILRDGGTTDGALIDLVMPAAAERTARRPPIALSVRRVQRYLGATLGDTGGESALSRSLIEQYLSALGCSLSPSVQTDDHGSLPPISAGLHAGVDYVVHLPSWRLDLEREIDLIEEVARVFGYNSFRNSLPAPEPVRRSETAARERALRSRLLALGFSEAISTTFSSAADAALFAPADASQSAGEVPPGSYVALENPLSAEASLLRPSLVPGMLGMLAANLNRDTREVRLFEHGHIFSAALAPGDSMTGVAGIAAVTEFASLVLGLTSTSSVSTDLHSAADAPIFELKGAIESLVTLFALPGGAESLRFTREGTPAWLEPGRGGTALLHGRVLAWFGELAHADVITRKLRQPVFLAAMNVEELLALPLRRPMARELSRFQAVERDFSFLFADTTEWHTVAAAIHALALSDLQRLVPVEIFRDPRGKAVPAGQHSLLLRASFQSATRTLTEVDLQEASLRLIAALTALGGSHRA